MIGQTISHYRVVEKLGGGGMGVVYKAEDVKLDRFVALKFLPDDVAKDPQALARFQREAKAASALNHPNICTIYEIDDQHGDAFIAMEFLDGMTLKHRIGGRPMETEAILSLAIEIADALDAAHAENIIHRDIKPANMMLTPQGVIKLMDFGIARGGEDRSLTMTGTTMGSLSYMSPEQVKGEPTDARSDLYSVGVSLYEMVTGQRPFVATSDYSIMAAHVKETPKPPAELHPGLPAELNEIILMAIAKDPSAMAEGLM